MGREGGACAPPPGWFMLGWSLSSANNIQLGQCFVPDGAAALFVRSDMIPSELDKQQHKKQSKTCFLTSMFKQKKSDDEDSYGGIFGVCPVSASLSVHATLDLMPCSMSSTLTLTPGRTRNLDQDMEALRLSRQDNPFLQLLASRESLLDSDDCNDAAILMSNEHVVSSLDLDPLSLPEIHEHMIRSPPPTTWPRSPNSRVFQFPVSDCEDDSSQESLTGHGHGSQVLPKATIEHSSPKRSRSVIDNTDFAERSLEFGVMGNRMTGRLSLTPKAPRRCSSDSRGPFSILSAPSHYNVEEEEFLVGSAPHSAAPSSSHKK
ncbi:uncharacterized protein LOC132198399 [Neocloeon triangulifer]|uniref:uncharacterized protein LOC132198399 n=1 Tax=Neocloeon triangulifer TaxID=2078957 RepID=UPI00286F2F83|nr:uncharacterized protein LOC132198399 [Neocloeon triangulifer]